MHHTLTITSDVVTLKNMAMFTVEVLDMRNILIACLLVLAGCKTDVTVQSTEAPYTWEVIRVLDGDTVEVDAKFFPPELGNIRVRIDGIDTPESGGRAKCAAERNRAIDAKAFAQEKLLGKKITVVKVKTDKYGGRIVGEILVDGKPYRAMLLENQLAKPYDGGTKQSWCNL